MITENQYNSPSVRYGFDNQRQPTYLKSQKKATNRLLITVQLLRSSGALKLVVSASESVEQVVGDVLKFYDRQGRFPLLGLDNTQFTLYPVTDCTQALEISKCIRDVGTRSFLLLRNEVNLLEKDQQKTRNRILITIDVMRSSIILKLVVNANDSIEQVVENALKCYDRHAYFPRLGLDRQRFRLYPSTDNSQALEACQCIGDNGTRNFVISTKQIDSRELETNVKCRKSYKWKKLFNRMGFRCRLCFD